ncbi:MAG: hypothetical protein KGY45_03820, partial [Hadesarchaea archaeon]|nr:hypothetical protein [Hadesarchaea archaeon]
MLKPVEMTEARIIIPTDKRGEVVRELHESGDIQITSINEELSSELELEREQPPEDTRKASEITMRVNRILDIFKKPPNPESSMTEKIGDLWRNYFQSKELEKLRIESESREEAIRVAQEYLEKVESEARKLNQEIENSQDEIRELENQIQSLKLLKDFNFGLKNLKTTEFTFSEAGVIPSNQYLEFLNNLDKSIGDEYVVLSSDVSEENKVVCLWTLIEFKEEVVEILNSHGFEPLDLPKLRGYPGKELGKLENKLEEIKNKKINCYQEIRELSEKHEKNLLAIRELFNIEKERSEVVNNFCRTETVSIIQGWIPEDKFDEVKNIVLEASDGVAHV